MHSNENLASLPIQELRRRSQSTAPEAGRDPLLGHTIRFASIYITKYIFLRTPITPNWITVVSVLFFFLGISLYVFDNLTLQLIGSFIIWFSVVLDGCDGEMARLRGNPSGVGSIYTEPVSHDIMYSYTFFPIAIGLYLSGFPEWILLVGWLAASAKMLQRVFIMRFDKVRKFVHKDVESLADDEGDPAVVFNPNVSFLHKVYRFLNRNFFSSVGFVIPLTAAALVGHLEWFLYLFAGFFSFIALIYFVRHTHYITNLSRKNRASQ